MHGLPTDLHAESEYSSAMVIVSGWLRVAPHDRAEYLNACGPVIEAARATDACVGFYLVPDPLESGMINIFEQWESAEAVERFRREGPAVDLSAMVVDAHVEQHEIARTTLLT